MINVSGFPGLIHATPQQNEPGHFLTARLLEGRLGSERASVEADRAQRASEPISASLSSTVLSSGVDITA